MEDRLLKGLFTEEKNYLANVYFTEPTNAKYKQQYKYIINVSTLQKTTNKIADDSIFFIASGMLVYFISYFFIFIDDNRMKAITLDCSTALISLIPTIVFLVAILLFYKFSSNKTS